MSEQQRRDSQGPREIFFAKIATGLFDDDKIKAFDDFEDRDSIDVIWIKLILQAVKCNANGFVYLDEGIPFTDESMASVFRRSVQSIRRAVTLFKENKMVEFDNETGYLLLPNFLKWQNEDGLNRIKVLARTRQQRRRERIKEQKLLLLSDSPDKRASVTLPSRDNVIEQKQNSSNSEVITQIVTLPSRDNHVTGSKHIDRVTLKALPSRDNHVTITPLERDGDIDIKNKELKEKEDSTFKEMQRIWETNTGGNFGDGDIQLLEDIAEDFSINLFEKAVKQSVREKNRNIRMKYVDNKLREFGVKENSSTQPHRTTDEELERGLL